MHSICILLGPLKAFNLAEEWNGHWNGMAIDDVEDVDNVDDVDDVVDVDDIDDIDFVMNEILCM